VTRRARILGVFLAVLALVATTARAQTGAPPPINVTVQPFMTKGPATAPVTIVEFSDYQ